MYLGRSLTQIEIQWPWQAEFLSHTLQFLNICVFLKDIEMILVPLLTLVIKKA